MRFAAGPYTMVLWSWTSAIDGLYYPSAFLAKNDKVIFTATHSVEHPTEKFVVLREVLGPPGVHGTFGNDSPGWDVFLVDPKSLTQYYFSEQHKNIMFEAPHGQPDEYTRFVGTVTFTAPDQTFMKGVSIGEQSFIRPTK
ncbi:hypothetical protein M7I_2739 [Glarea lozoyensis 74030]|nr:hypothetical protein M7I_2739 [Glarea lozoyensis 74030]